MSPVGIALVTAFGVILAAILGLGFSKRRVRPSLFFGLLAVLVVLGAITVFGMQI